MKLPHTCAILLLILSISSYASDDKAIHPEPKEPRLLTSSLLPELKKGITLPPTLKSEAQKNDEETLRSIQKTRSDKDCERAKTEVYITLTSFYGQSHGPLTLAETAPLAPLFEQIRNDADYYIQLLKKEYPRQRPFLYMKDLNPCVPKEVTGAYPSGHATLAQLYSLVLTDFFPTKKDALAIRAQEIANDRVLSGMHHPSDIQAGKELGTQLYKEFIKSESYKELISKARKHP